MKVEFLGRFADRNKTKEEKEEEEIQRLINPEFIPDKEIIKYTYDPITIDLENVDEWIKLDSIHTQLNMKQINKFFVVKIPYIIFCRIYEELTGESVKVVQVTKENIPFGNIVASLDEEEGFEEIEDEQ